MRYRLTFVCGLAVGYVLGARAGRERYEQLRKSAQQVTRNPAVRNAAESAVQTGREVAAKAAGRVGDRLPGSVTERVRSLREQRGAEQDDWGTSNT
ncbi:YtxH domain-containing protein [Streptomyces sp. URMC 123]|uniref:YtxH domain-containing protein n=1 Tax=Streptomyces sp. URMC 123 TaxID=3423403 RepID=UPI003F1B7F6D